VELGTGAHVRCLGKGRKMRYTPLRPDVASVLKEWLSERGGGPNDPVFPSSLGTHLSADALQRLFARHTVTARQTCPLSHTLRHSA
jgi:site-specific recombinase XerC